MNLILNPGFESPNAWSYANAQRSASYSAHAGSYVAELTFTGSQAGVVSQRITPISGAIYRCTVYVQRISGGNGITAYLLDDQQNVAGLAQISGVDVQPGWQVLTFLGSTTRPYVDFTVQTIDDAGSTPSVWIVDDCEVDIVPGSIQMRREPLNAYITLFNRLKTINGAPGGYYNDFSSGGNIITRRRLPADNGAPKPPYLCLPLEDTGPIQTTEDFAHGAVSVHRQPIYFFWPSSEFDGVVEDSSAVIGLKTLSDLLRCLMPPSNAPWWNYGTGSNYLEDVSIISKRMVSEIDMVEGFPAAHGVIVVDLKQRFTRENLGPSV